MWHLLTLKKAFDSVNRNALWHVLRKSGIKGKMYFALRGVYDSVRACVRDKCNCTEYFDCPRGVKQGYLLGPQMFAFFINELAIEMSKKKKKKEGMESSLCLELSKYFCCYLLMT